MLAVAISASEEWTVDYKAQTADIEIINTSFTTLATVAESSTLRGTDEGTTVLTKKLKLDVGMLTPQAVVDWLVEHYNQQSATLLKVIRTRLEALCERIVNR